MANILDPAPMFVTRDEVQTKLGDQMIDTVVTHHGENAIEAACGQATDYVLFYLQRKAPAAVLAQVRMVRNWAKIGACYYLTSDLGETHVASFAEEYERMTEQLQMVLDGKAEVPGLPAGTADKGGCPVVSAMAVDANGCQPSMRVNRPASTGVPAGYQPATFLPTTVARKYR